jgi:hypothetical protein
MDALVGLHLCWLHVMCVRGCSCKGWKKEAQRLLPTLISGAQGEAERLKKHAWKLKSKKNIAAGGRRSIVIRLCLSSLSHVLRSSM